MALALGFGGNLSASEIKSHDVECSSYTFQKLSSQKLSDELTEMSGLVRTEKGLAHIQDSGNDPYLLFTRRDGELLEKIRFAEVSTDAEELVRSECPWGGSPCLYVFDTGDNLHWRSVRNIWAVEEKTLRSLKPRIENLEFTFPGGERIDSEAAVIVGRTIVLFAKERKHARVFTLDKSAWSGGGREAKLVDDLPYTMITGAAATDDGSRILILSWQGAVELSQHGSGPKAKSSWYPYRKRIKLKTMAQQEAIAYDADQRSFLYSSERKVFSKDEWGIMLAQCVRKL